MKLRVLIVDDEPLARQRIRDLLDDADVFEAEDGPSALSAVAENKPDLIFLDVQMPGMDGFEVIEHLEPPLPMIIFTTAYEAYALRAFEVSAVDYLLKPIDANRFEAAMNRVRTPNARIDERITALLARIEKRDKSLRRIVVKEESRVFFVETRSVDWFEAAGNYVRVHVNGTSHLIRSTLQSLEASLDTRTFARIHRSAIVNVARIVELQPKFRGHYAVVLKSGEELEMSAAYRDQLKAAIGDF